MQKVVMVESNFTGLDAIEKYKSEGYWVVYLTDDPTRADKWFPNSEKWKLGLVDEVIVVEDSNDFDELRRVLEDLHGGVDVLLTFAEIRTAVVALLCQALGLPGASPSAVAIAQNKHMTREMLRQSHVDTVMSTPLSKISELIERAPEFDYPVFIKPSRGHSSIGAVECRDVGDVERVVARLEEVGEDWISTEYVVETLLEGNLVSVEILTVGAGQHHVVGVSDRDVVNGMVEIGASFPMQDARSLRAAEKACEMLDAIGFDFGASHVEMMIAPDGAPHLVEINTRVGGSGHSRMLDIATGESIVGDCLDLCLGKLRKDDPLYASEKGAAWMCLISPFAGRIVSSATAEEIIEANEGVEDIWFHREPGDEVGAPDSNYSWIVQVLCSGQTRDEAKRNADRAIEFVRVRTKILRLE